MTDRMPAQSSGDAGARAFRRVALLSAGVYFLVLGIVCVEAYWNYKFSLENPADHFLSKGLQEKATLEYYLFWCVVSGVSLAEAWNRKTLWLAFYLNLVLVGETGAYVYFFATHRHLYRPALTYIDGKFDPNPFVVAIPHPGEVVPGVTHDAWGHRTTVNEGKIADPRLIYVFGGSTTYDIGNVDADTWASDLSRLLGPDFAVENYGVMGFSSLEAMMQSLFAFRDKAPACAIYYEGWNDADNAYRRGLRPDYSDSEVPRLREALGLSRRQGFLERNSLLVGYAFSLLRPARAEDERTVSGEKDPRLSRIYKDNIRLIAAIAQTFGVRAIFIPQVLDKAFPGEEASYKLMDYMDDDLAQAAADQHAYFMAAPLRLAWTRGDFVDDVHFRPQGARKFAEAIVEDVRRICR